MSRILRISTLLLSLFAASAQATVIEVPLPGLLGTYEETVPFTLQLTTRTVTFHLQDPPGIVYGASFRVSGTTEVGTLLCEERVSEWPTTLYATMEDTPLNYWWAQDDMPFVAGAFAWTAPFTTIPPPATWNFLMDGTAQIRLSGGPSGFVAICTPTSPAPTLTVTEAVLVIDAEFPIRTEPSTWGKIKALYRR